MTTSRLGSYENPCTGKEFKETLIHWLDLLVNKDESIEFADGKYCIFVKFANGRLAKVERRSEKDEFDDAITPLLVHDTDYKQLRRNWTTISAGIVFGIAFAFEYKNKIEDKCRLVIYKCEDHQGDDFVGDIVVDMQTALEFDAFQEISDRMEAGFKRVEKLIKQSY